MAQKAQQDELAGAICYIGFFISGLIILAIEKKNLFIRFHAMQSAILFSGIFVIVLIFQLYPWGWLPGLMFTFSAFILWVVLMWKALQGEMYKVFIVGDLAEKQLDKMGK